MLGDQFPDTNYALYKLIYGVSPAQTSPFMQAQDAMRKNVLLLWKLSFGFDLPGGIHSFEFGPNHGFEFGDPSGGHPVAVRSFDDFDKQFRNDDRQSAIFGLFVGVAIFIACLGLFGLAAFTAGRRTREIGVRKVFGARTRDVIFLLLWQFSIPVLVANAIAWPLAWYYLHNWLEGYAYRIPLSPAYFLVVGMGALLIAWATIFTHARRVAVANPINALRYE